MSMRLLINDINIYSYEIFIYSNRVVYSEIKKCICFNFYGKSLSFPPAKKSEILKKGPACGQHPVFR